MGIFAFEQNIVFLWDEMSQLKEVLKFRFIKHADNTNSADFLLHNTHYPLHSTQKMFDSLPSLTPSRIAVKVKTAAERMIRKEHPWVFDESIVKQSKEGKAGDLAIIYDQKKNKLLAIGLYDPYSPMRIKVLQFKTGASIDEKWFGNKIKEAFEKRQPLLATDSNSYRFIHGENDGFPGLVVDVYAEVMVIKLYSAIWLPYLKIIAPLLLDQTNCQTIVLRLSRQLQNLSKEMQGLFDGQVLYGELDGEEVVFREHGLLFTANPIKGHKTGYFLDHRHNRKRVGELSKGKTVLDVFAYAGGFSVHALAGGAKEVISLDISAQALEMAKKNVLLNIKDASRHRVMSVDAFEGLENLFFKRKKFDLIIVDPPSFAKKESEQEKAIQAYAQLTQLAARLVKDGGILVMASCSSRVSANDFFTVVLATIQSTGRPFRELERHLHDVDHPIGFPEGGYLKCIYVEF